MAISGVAVGAIAVGAVFVYGGFTGKSPSAALVAIVRGKNPSGVPGPLSTAQALATGGQSSDSGGGGAPAAPADGSQAIAQQIIKLKYPQWNSANDWSALVSLWNRESGWSNTADTRQTGAGGDHPGSAVFAYGIAQARPATKYPKLGQPPDLGGQSDPQSQIVWGLEYIAGRYGSPAAAWQHELANNWY